ncbi:MAG: zinc-ribbon domain-containing protein [Pseudomonadota bacterium]
MIIPCPACKTKFKVKEDAFGDKKLIKFQCAKCKHLFQFNRETGQPVESVGAPRPGKPEPEAMMAAMEAVKATARAPKRARTPEKDLEDRPTTEFNKADMERPTTEFVKQGTVKVVYEESYESFELEKEAASPEPEPEPEPEPGPGPEAAGPEAAGQADETAKAQADQEAAIAGEVKDEAAASGTAEEEARAEEAPKAEEEKQREPLPAEVEEKAEAAKDEALAARAEADRGEAHEPLEESPVESEQAAAQAAAQEAGAPAARGDAARAGRADSMRNILTSGPYILALEDALEDEPLQRASGRSRAVGIAAILILLVFAVVFVFVAWKNDWDFAALFTNPGSAISIATGQKAMLLVAPEAKGIETALTRVYTTQTINDIRILVVEGEVLNTSVFPKKQIRLYLELLNIGGSVVATMEVPSGITMLAEREIQEKTFSGLRLHLETERETADEWVVNSNRKASFQAFFPDSPSGADDPDRFTVRATAISAVNALAK